MGRGDRRSTILAAVTAVLGVGLLGFHVAYKRRPDSREVARFASGFKETSRWQGRLAPDFELSLQDGTAFHLADEIGKRVVILNFFTTWCGPCKAEMPELDRFVRLAAGQPVTLLGIDGGERPEVVGTFLASIGLRLRVGIDGSGGLLEEYGVDSFPTTVLIGPDGRIRLYEVGPILNADVAFGELVRAASSEIDEGKGISREAYLQANEAGLASAAPNKESPSGRAAEISRKMACPCGCDRKVSDCGCATARGIRKRLASEGLESRSEEEIVRNLNREFCRSGA